MSTKLYVGNLSYSTDERSLEDLFAEACEYWRERQVPFWVFVT